MEAAPDTIVIFVKSGSLGRKKEQEDAIEIIVTGEGWEQKSERKMNAAKAAKDVAKKTAQRGLAGNLRPFAR
jgi:hypothetical protein